MVEYLKEIENLREEHKERETGPTRSGEKWFIERIVGNNKKSNYLVIEFLVS